MVSSHCMESIVLVYRKANEFKKYFTLIYMASLCNVDALIPLHIRHTKPHTVVNEVLT